MRNLLARGYCLVCDGTYDPIEMGELLRDSGGPNVYSFGLHHLPWSLAASFSPGSCPLFPLLFQSLAQVPHWAPAPSLWHLRSIGQPENVEITRIFVTESSRQAGSVHLAANAFTVD